MSSQYTGTKAGRPSRASTTQTLLRSDDDLLDHTFRTSSTSSSTTSSTISASPLSKLKPGEWVSYQQIPSDISLSDYHAQAYRNNFAASRAMKIIPQSILYPSDDPYRNIPNIPETPPGTRSKSPFRIMSPPQTFPASTDNIDDTFARVDAAWDRAQAEVKPGAHDKGWDAAREFRPFPPMNPASRPTALGWRSKKDQLGSVTASWGLLPPALNRDPAYAGVFDQIEAETKSQDSSLEEEVRPSWQEVRNARDEALGRARIGTQQVRGSSGGPISGQKLTGRRY